MFSPIANFAIEKTFSILLISLLGSLIFAGVISIAIIYSNKEKLFKEVFLETFVISLVFGTLALVTGFLTGNSRESAVAAVVPAVLTLIGGLALYIIDKDYSKFYVTAISVFSFSVMLLLGSALGSLERQNTEYLSKSYRTLKRQADEEQAVKLYRQSLGLDPIASSAAE